MGGWTMGRAALLFSLWVVPGTGLQAQVSEGHISGVDDSAPLGSPEGTQGIHARQEAAEAERLEAEAAALDDQRHRWSRAAALYRRAAELRPTADPRAVENLLKAGKLLYYTGDRSAALEVLEGAAERALADGDVVTAAHAFLDAAWVAGRLGRAQTENELAEKGDRLSRSPLISPDDRTALLRRIQPPIREVAARPM